MADNYEDRIDELESRVAELEKENGGLRGLIKTAKECFDDIESITGDALRQAVEMRDELKNV